MPTQAIINFAAGMGWCHPIKVKRFPVNPETKTPAKLEWVMAFAAEASPHLGALCIFMFSNGARLGEAVRLKWADVDMTARTARLSGDKPRPWTRLAHLPPPVIAALANIPSNRNPDDLVFGYAGRGSVKQPWASVISRAGIEYLTPHCCRHGFATTMLRKGYDVKTVAQLGGWKDPAILLRTYAHALEDCTVTDAIFDTNSAQDKAGRDVTIGQKREKKA